MRTGKIARLPHPIREQLNRRLEASEAYEPILNWLNALPEARQVIDDHFAGLPISKQNLSDWRSGGFSEWQDRQDAADFLTNLDDQSEPNPQTSSSPSTGRMALWLSLQYALAARALVRSPVDPTARWARLREICADIARLRRSDFSLNGSKSTVPGSPSSSPIPPKRRNKSSGPGPNAPTSAKSSSPIAKAVFLRKPSRKSKKNSNSCRNMDCGWL